MKRESWPTNAVKGNLMTFAGMLRKNTDCDVAIKVHTDKSGNDQINIML